MCVFFFFFCCLIELCGIFSRRRLYLSDNIIADIGRGTFTSITRIGTIDLARNQIKKIDYQMFGQLNYVEIIDLAENNIVEVQKQSFKDLYLTHINMSHNAITKFEAGSFENCVNMTTLDLSHNQINAFSKYAFDELSYATNFLLSFNAFTNLSAVSWPRRHSQSANSSSFLFFARFLVLGATVEHDRIEGAECIAQ